MKGAAMNFSVESNTVGISSCELAAFHLYRKFPYAAKAGGFDILRDSMRGSSEVKFTYTFSHRSLEWEMYAEASKYENDRLTFKINAPFVSDDDSHTLFARANAFLCAFACMMITGKKKLEICLIFKSDKALPPESVSLSAATKFFRSSVEKITSPRDLGLEITDRESLRSVKFPYKQMREAQSDFIKHCFNAIKKEKRLYACAPTGVGKTVSTLFPAVRALGCGVIDKIFYLTPRGITNNSAAEAVSILFRGGAQLRAVEILSREKCCSRGLMCKTAEGCNIKRRKKADYTSAALEIFSRKLPFVSASDISSEAKKHSLCPHELSLAYSELCDVIICDYNYLFDPGVALVRYFEGSHGRYCFLVDEAHNLPERARELYSTRISPRRFAALGEKIREPIESTKSKALREALASISSALAELAAYSFEEAEVLTRDVLSMSGDGVKRAIYKSRDLPSELPERLAVVCEKLNELCYCNKNIGEAFSKEELFSLRNDASELCEFSRKLSYFDRDFNFFIFRSDDEYEFVSYCNDPARLISSRLDIGRSAIFFSGTLYPLNFFKCILGGRASDLTCEFESPYDSDRLAIVAYDGIETKFSRREETLFDVAKVIKATVSQRRGNYLVFAPSYAYLREIHRGFSAICGGEFDTVLQKERMTPRERSDFILRFSPSNQRATIGFCVLGGLFSESLNLTGEALIGSVIVGVALPRPTPFSEAIAEYFNEKYEEGFEFAYLYPSAEKIFQAGGRVIRSEDDRGVLVLIDSRYDDPRYKKLFPEHWHGLKFTSNIPSLSGYLQRFWNSGNK